ncbi:MAG: GTPase, partial [Acidimicrobiia bacterium]
MVDRLGVAALAARDLGLPDEAAVAEELLRRIEQRIGFVGDVYVLALAGGTGVGKSSVLNALAGETVSRVGAVRPMTEQPLAWVKGNQRHELSPLLEWLGVDQVVGHDRPDLV